MHEGKLDFIPNNKIMIKSQHKSFNLYTFEVRNIYYNKGPFDGEKLFV